MCLPENDEPTVISCYSFFSTLSVGLVILDKTRLPIELKTPANSAVPVNTRAVPIQCCIVNGFWKYRIENNRERNFRKVMMRVTTSEGHSVVSMKTPEIHVYLQTMSRNYTERNVFLHQCTIVPVNHWTHSINVPLDQ